MEYVYRNTRPRLLVENKGSKKLGNCYSASFFTVTSTFELDEDKFEALFITGAIGYGQDFYIKSSTKGSDLVPCVGIDEDKEIQNPVNPYSGKPYQQHPTPFWVYEIATHCDSGD